MNNLMIDIETLSTRPDAAILSIGAVFFDPATQKIGGLFNMHIHMTPSETYGHICPETVRWWMQQKSDAREDAFKGEENNLLITLCLLEKWIIANSDPKKVKIWAKSPSFDLVILTSAYRRFNKKPPWDYWNERDLRTFTALGPELLKINTDKPKNIGTKHTALDDAMTQVMQILNIYQQAIK